MTVSAPYTSFFSPIGKGTRGRFSFLLTPNAPCAGPWSPKLQFGGTSTCALQGVLSAAMGPERQLSHMSVFFFRPMAMTPCEVAVRMPLLRDGKKAAHAEASWFAPPPVPEGVDPMSVPREEWKECARAVAVFIQRKPSSTATVPAAARTPSATTKFVPVPKKALLAAGSMSPWFSSFVDCFDWRLNAEEADPAVYRERRAAGAPTMFSTRLTTPVLPPEFYSELGVAAPAPDASGKLIDPLHRLLMISDGTCGFSTHLSLRKTSFVNPYHSVTILRVPESPWVTIRARSDVNPEDGCGTSTSTMFDEKGLCAQISQCQVVEDLPPRAPKGEEKKE